MIGLGHGSECEDLSDDLNQRLVSFFRKSVLNEDEIVADSEVSADSVEDAKIIELLDFFLAIDRAKIHDQRSKRSAMSASERARNKNFIVSAKPFAKFGKKFFRGIRLNTACEDFALWLDVTLKDQVVHSFEEGLQCCREKSF